MGKSLKTYRELTLLLSYLVGLNAFFSLWNVSDPVFTGLLFLTFLFSAYNDFFKVLKIPRLLLNVVALSGTLFFVLSISFDNLIEPVANALLLLLSVKFLEEKKVRDFYQILLLSLLSVSLATLIKTDILFILLLVYELLVGTLLLFILPVYRRFESEKVDYSLIKRLLIFSTMFGISVFLASWIFFLILPRVENPLIDIFQRRDKGLISGISDDINLGEIGEIQLDRSVVFRVFGISLKGEPYWRVQVFDTYSKNRWIRTVNLPEIESGRGKRYTLILEPTYDRFLPVLNYPVKILKVEGVKDKPTRFKGGYYLFREPISKPVRVIALYTEEPPRDKPLKVYLQIPKNLPKSIKKLAEELQKGTKTDIQKIRKVESFFKRSGFKYTLKLEAYEGDPLEDFLFRKRKGNCEYFASATAILLRLMGIPARVVAGFHGAIKNKYGNYYIVLAGMAHVWVEAYVNGKWITVDTTPPYVPESLRDISTFTYIYDAIIAFWYKNVVNFSTETQKSLLLQTKKFLFSFTVFVKRNIRNLALSSVLLLILGFLVYFYQNEIRKTPENLFKKLKRRLRRYGIEAELPEEVIRLSEGHPRYKYIEFIVRTYERWKYSRVKDREELKEAYKVLKKV